MTQKIYLTKGKVALVDDGDFEYLNQWRWSFAGGTAGNYARRNNHGDGRKTILMHRLIMNAPDGVLVDHRDGNGLNNQKSNLRLCTHAQNMANRLSLTNSTSGYRGVSYHKGRGFWVAYISHNNKQIHLGKYATAEEAAHAYDAAAQRLQGEFARLNFS